METCDNVDLEALFVPYSSADIWNADRNRFLPLKEQAQVCTALDAFDCLLVRDGRF